MRLLSLLQPILKSKVAKAGIGYSIGNILIRGISFITVPIFTYLMSVEDFGLYTTFVAYESIFFLFIGLCLHSSIRSANQEFPGEINSYLSSIASFQVLLFLGSLAILGGLYLTGIDPLQLGFLSLFFMVIVCFSSSVSLVYNNFLSLTYNYKKYLYLSLFSTLGNVGFSVLLILYVFSDERYIGRIAGTALAAGLMTLYILYAVYKLEKPSLNGHFIKFGCRYSWPIIPHGLSQVMLAQFARIIIQRSVGNTAAGLFGFAFTIAIIPQVIASSLDTVWSTWFFENFKTNRELIKERAILYLILFSVITLGLVTIAPEIVYLLAPKPYWDAQYIVIPAMMCMYVMFLYYFPAVIEYYKKKTIFIATGSGIAAIVNIALNLYCIPKYGYVSAVYVTLATYILYLIFHLFIAIKLEKNVYNLNAMTLVVAIISCSACMEHLLIESFFSRLAAFVIAICLIAILNKNQLLKICGIKL